ncbi:bifunctional adenosylcobinamide kinase/adenosylcobinamide-phosphate guanylyltransferase [Janibacter hoylei]|nr:bifunctional adenosylcobinamide kinase/adenosylcobinamide-phosphate guanylyltransferase [Janibacter hoylei]
MRVLVTGGIRSGKSRHAESLLLPGSPSRRSRTAAPAGHGTHAWTRSPTWQPGPSATTPTGPRAWPPTERGDPTPG